MAKIITFKKYPELLCNHEGAQFVNDGYCTGYTSNNVPYEAELWHDGECVCLGVVLPYIKEFGPMHTDAPSQASLPKVINLAQAKKDKKECEGPDFSILCLGMVDDGEETELATIVNYVNFLVEEQLVEFTSERYHGCVKYRVDKAGNSVVEVMLVLQKGTQENAVAKLEFRDFLIEHREGKAKIIGFHDPKGEYGCFSNWYPAIFKYAGKVFTSVEQYMMYHKVMLGYEFELAEQILLEDNPSRIKELAGPKYFHAYDKIKDVWKKYRYTIVKRGVRAKFLQNSALLEELLLTDRALLVECSRSDRVWGNGISIKNTDWKDVRRWSGDNRLGRILMELRTEFIGMILLKKKLKFVDAYEASPIYEWTLPAAELARHPDFHNTIAAYADTLCKAERGAFMREEASLAKLEISMDMGMCLPVNGFYEMKQEIYDIADRFRLD